MIELKYAEGLKRWGTKKIIKYGIAFWEKMYGDDVSGGILTMFTEENYQVEEDESASGPVWIFCDRYHVAFQ